MLNRTKLISWLFLLYFVILFGERLQSLIRAISQNGLFSSSFDDLVNLTAIMSLCSAVILLLTFNISFWKSLFSDIEPDYSTLTIAAGVMLVSGMVHTECTIPAIQFVAYGALILAMILYALEISGIVMSRFCMWYSLAYLTVFSMAIPVVYRSWMANAGLFHLIEAVVMLALVTCFTVMLRKYFVDQDENMLKWVPFGIMLVGDTVLIVMRWQEEVNVFVLIFAALSAVLFFVGKILFRRINA